MWLGSLDFFGEAVGAVKSGVGGAGGSVGFSRG